VGSKEPLVEPLGNDERAVILSVQEEPYRLGLRCNRTDCARDVIRQRVGEVPVDFSVATYIVVHHKAAYGLRRCTEQYAGRQLTRTVLPTEIQPEPGPRRGDATAATVNPHADAGCKNQFSALEVRHAAFALPLLTVLALVGEEPLDRVIQVGLVQGQRQDRNTTGDLAD
jgi:hypothetical protein